MDRALNGEEIDLCVVGGVIGPLLQAAADEPSIARRRYLLHALERALRLADPGMISDAFRQAAEALGLAPPSTSPEPPSNAVLVPLVARDFGFVRTLFVTFRPWGDVLDRALSRTSASTVLAALELAAEVTGRGTAEGYALTPAQPHAFEHLEVDGDSLGAAAFVSAASLWTGRPIRPGTVVTGALRGRQVCEVGGLAAKLEGVQRTSLPVRTFIVPAADARALPQSEELAVVGVATVDELLDASLEPTAARRADNDELVHDAMRSFRKGWEQWHWAGMQAQLERLLGGLPDRRPDLLVQVYAMLAGTIRHGGQPEESLDILDRARAILDTEDGRAGVPDQPLSFFFRQRAMALRQIGAFDAAWEAAVAAIHAAEHGRLRGELIPSHGTAGLVASSRGQEHKAIEHHRQALAIALRHAPSSAPRSTSYLVQSLARDGRWEEAEHTFREGLEQIARFSSERSQGSRNAWLRVSYAGALASEGRSSHAIAVLDHPAVRDAIVAQPRPGLEARRALGLALVMTGREAEGYATLAASPTAYGRLLGGHSRSIAEQNVLHEAVLRLERGELTDDARARALRAIEEIPAYDAAAAWLQPLAANAADALEDIDAFGRADAAASLRALLDACERLG